MYIMFLVAIVCTVLGFIYTNLAFAKRKESTLSLNINSMPYLILIMNLVIYIIFDIIETMELVGYADQTSNLYDIFGYSMLFGGFLVLSELALLYRIEDESISNLGHWQYSSLLIMMTIKAIFNQS